MPASQIWNLGSGLRIVKTFHFQMQKMVLPEKDTFKWITDQWGYTHKIFLQSCWSPGMQPRWSGKPTLNRNSRQKTVSLQRSREGTHVANRLPCTGDSICRSTTQWMLNGGRSGPCSFKKNFLALRLIESCTFITRLQDPGAGELVQQLRVRSTLLEYWFSS